MRQTSLPDVTWWVEQLEKGRSGEIFDGPTFLRPVHFAMLGCHILRVGATALTVPDRLEQYASRMHLWQCVNLECPRKVKERDPAGKFHPLSPIESEASAEGLSDAVREMFRVSGTTEERTLSAIGISLSEIFSNCFFHAETGRPIAGLACAQSWARGKLAQVAVADFGIGIRRSLEGNPAYADRLLTENANALATELGVTSKPGGQHAGYGLAVARQLMTKHGGNLVMVSGSEGFRATKNGAWRSELRVPWQGTIVVLEWKTGQPMDMNAVYGSWPKTGVFADDFA